MKDTKKFLKLFRKIYREDDSRSFDDIVDLVILRMSQVKTHVLTEQEARSARVSNETLKEVDSKIKKKIKSLGITEQIIDFASEDEYNYFLERVAVSDTVIKEQNLYSSVKSTILLIFMKQMIDMTIDKDLTDTVDFNSLSRLSLRAGGTSIEIPTYDQVENILAYSYYAYLILVEDISQDKASVVVKKKLGHSVSVKKAKPYLSKLAMVLSQETYQEKLNVRETFDTLLDVVGDLQEKLKNSLESLDDPEEILKVYTDVSNSFLVLTKAVSKIYG